LGTSNYIYDGRNSVGELDASGTWSAKYTQNLGLDEPLAVQRSAAYFFEPDGLGSITSISDASSALSSSFVYGSTGSQQSSSSSTLSSFRYTAREWDSETNLYYYRARYYDAALGKFLSEDPIRFGGGDVNLYRYVMNDPVDSDDALGMRLNPKPGSGTQGGIDLTNYEAAINLLNQDPQAAMIIAVLSARNTTYNVVFEHDGDDYYDPNTHTIHWDPLSAIYCTCGGGQSPANGLFHEMVHAAGSGPHAEAMANTADPEYDNREERRVIRTYETPFSLRHGECVRHDHKGTEFNVTDPRTATFPVPQTPQPRTPPGLQ
jgi:RHS repeat-associated protein